MTIYRSPVKDAPIGQRVLHCEGASCAERFKAHPIGDEMFLCRNHGRGLGKCFSTAFAYPRKQLRTLSASDSKNGDGVFQHYHQGIDVVRRIGPEGAGDPILSVTEGKVVHIEPVETFGKKGNSGGYGISIMIESSVPWRPGPLYFFYSHCESIAFGLELGSPVSEQQEIAKVGSTGNARATKPHLHFEVRTSATLPKSRSWRTEATQHDLGILRLDPLEVLRQLGPWGMSTVYFPNEQLSAATQGENPKRKPVNPQTTLMLHTKVEQSPRGGYFPLGANNDWHGGVHFATTPNQTIVAPFDGTIVAFRLDSDPVASLEDAGHINFILLRHEISEPAAALLNPAASPTVDPKATPGTPGNSKASSVGRGGSNEPELVLHVKNGLHAHMSPTGAPFYAPTNYKELNDPYPDDELYAAIEAFQASLPAPKAGKKKKKSPPPWPDGVMTVGGYTWKSLFGENSGLPMHKDGDPEGGDPIALEPDAPAGGDPIAVEPEQPAAKLDPKRVVYSLLLHLGPRAVDAAAAKEFPWLAQGSLEPADDDAAGLAAAAAKQRRAEDKAESTYTLTRRVGFPEAELGTDPAPDAGAEDDIRWVQRRLARLADFTGPSDLGGCRKRSDRLHWFARSEIAERKVRESCL